jgi:exopolyphosphatase/guanosine-5'-triphosphate,3'-diphosphate pyrophosphatase
VRASVVLDPAPALCFDLGGGSLEVMIGDRGALHWATSLPIGVARLTAELVHSDPIDKGDRRALRDRLVAELEPVQRAVAELTPRLAVGSSGSLEALTQMVAARRDEDTPSSLNQLTISRDDFRRCKGIRGRPRRRLRIPGSTRVRRPHRGRLDVPRHRDGALRPRHAHDLRVGAA